MVVGYVIIWIVSVVNWKAVFLSVIVNTMITMIWYSRSVLAISKRTLRFYLVNFVTALFMAAGLSLAITRHSSFNGGALLGFFVWLFFVAPTLYSPMPRDGNTPKLFYANLICLLVNLIVMGGIIGHLSYSATPIKY